MLQAERLADYLRSKLPQVAEVTVEFLSHARRRLPRDLIL
jgi:hypothetical protein